MILRAGNYVCANCGVTMDRVNRDYLCIESPNLNKGDWRICGHDWVEDGGLRESKAMEVPTNV